MCGYRENICKPEIALFTFSNSVLSIFLSNPLLMFKIHSYLFKYTWNCLVVGEKPGCKPGKHKAEFLKDLPPTSALAFADQLFTVTLGCPKRLCRFFPNMMWKNPSQLLCQHNAFRCPLSSDWLPSLRVSPLISVFNPPTLTTGDSCSLWSNNLSQIKLQITERPNRAGVILAESHFR